MTDNSSVVLGRVTAIHGIKGWLTIRSFTSNQSDIFTYNLFIINNDKKIDIKVDDYKILAKKIIIKIENINHIDQTTPFIDKDLFTHKKNLSKDDDSEYFWHDLTGCEVYNKANQKIGIVKFLERIGDNDIMIIGTNDKKKDILIPFIKTFVMDVNIKKRSIKVDWDEDF